MKYLLFFLVAFNTIYSVNSKKFIDQDKMEPTIKKSELNFVGYVKDEKNINLGLCFAINENTVVTNASSLQTIILIPDTLFVNGQQIISKKEIGRKWVDSSKLTLTIEGTTYDIEKVIPHPDYNESNSYLPDIAMIITKNSISCNYPQRSSSSIVKNLFCDVIGSESSIFYRRVKVSETFNTKSYNYCNVLLDTNDNKNSIKNEFKFDTNNLGSVLVKESENDVVIIGLIQKHQTDDKKAVYLDLFGLGEWLNSNAVSQITK